MPRYFLEVSYKGTNYSGFQIQKNANSIQGEVEKALEIYFHQKSVVVCSSRTDAGVHALQNFFHYDSMEIIPRKFLYNINAILPSDIAIKNIYQVPDQSSARFDALSRTYRYHVYRRKDPFLQDTAYYFPYSLQEEALHETAALVMKCRDFTSFSKRNTQVKDFICNIMKSSWLDENGSWIYEVRSNRFLRGMVRGLVATMLQVARGKLTAGDFEQILLARDCTRADFSVPGQGLFLIEVAYPAGLLKTV